MVAATESHRILALFRGTLFCMSYAAVGKTWAARGLRPVLPVKSRWHHFNACNPQRDGASGRTRTDGLPVYETGPVAAEAQRRVKTGRFCQYRAGVCWLSAGRSAFELRSEVEISCPPGSCTSSSAL